MYSTADLARSTYARPDAPARNARAVEYDIFARVTRAITQAMRPERPDFPALVRALHDNGRLWRTLAADLAEPGNALPPELRARLFYLYEFSAAHTRKVLEGLADAQPLVEVNTAVMRGLRGDSGSGVGS